MMKKVIALFVICLCGFAALADSPLNIGIHGGVSSNRIKVKDIPYEIKNKSHSGFIEQIAPWILDQVVHTYPEIISVISFTS